jgi:Domain of unknown function (4846)
MNRLFILSILSFFISCYWNEKGKLSIKNSVSQPDSLKIVSDIAPPQGYQRINLNKNSFGEWLRDIALKKDKHVYLYNGTLKRNQTAQFAVLNISVGKKDLQQCADALMRLRAEYLFGQERYSEIEFRDNAGGVYKWAGGDDKAGFEKYLEKVFGVCGSASLEKQLKPVASLKELQPGDVFIKGGFPGHAMIIIDVAVNDKGNKAFMLAQSYMPAQDIHIVRNPMNDKLSPWYEVNDEKEIITPEWIFLVQQLKKWN